MIVGLMIDSREPEEIKQLDFKASTSIVTLDTGDAWVMCDDGHLLMVERKTPDDFLGSLRDERLMPQMAHLAEQRQVQQLKGEHPTSWPYLVITDTFLRGAGGKTATPERGMTGWSWTAVQGALLTIQEMGVQVTFAAGNGDYVDCLHRLSNRSRADVIDLLPPRQPNLLGPREALLASLPGIGVERVIPLLRWGGTVAWTLAGLVDLEIPCPVDGVGKVTRQRIRDFLGLKDGQEFGVVMGESNQENLAIEEAKIG